MVSSRHSVSVPTLESPGGRGGDLGIKWSYLEMDSSITLSLYYCLAHTIDAQIAKILATGWLYNFVRQMGTQWAPAFKNYVSQAQRI